VKHHCAISWGSLTDVLPAGNVSCGAAPVIFGFAFYPPSSA
jgi:hypothetical protein